MRIRCGAARAAQAPFPVGYGRVGNAVEVESLGQGVVTGIVRDALDALLPEPLEHVLVGEESQRVEALERPAH
jgi:hypothetical protein